MEGRKKGDGRKNKEKEKGTIKYKIQIK